MSRYYSYEQPESQVVTYESPGAALRISVCATHEALPDKWPRDWAGQRPCRVYVGRHSGVCTLCQDAEVRS